MLQRAVYFASCKSGSWPVREVLEETVSHRAGPSTFLDVLLFWRATCVYVVIVQTQTTALFELWVPPLADAVALSSRDETSMSGVCPSGRLQTWFPGL